MDETINIMQIGMNIVLQSTIKKPSDLAKRTLLKTGTELMCSGMEIRFGPYKGIMSYLRYLCLFAHSSVQHILCCVLFCLSE
jgi:hypothetical protein